MEVSKFKFGQKATAYVIRKRKLGNPFSLKGVIHLEVWRKDKLINSYDFKNGVTDIGINTALDILFRDAIGDITGWTIGLIDSSGFSAVAPGDTAASHAGWTEFTAYDEANRVLWAPVAAASEAIANTTPASFDINAGGAENLKGVFINDNNTKGGSSGTLWATALFAGDIPVTSGDTIKITYTVTGA